VGEVVCGARTKPAPGCAARFLVAADLESVELDLVTDHGVDQVVEGGRVERIKLQDSVTNCSM